jgi:predicted DNA-binding protein (MmcQ/YjbR family)
MDLAALRKFLIAKKATTEETPFGPDVLVFKVLGKMYALIAWKADPLRLSLKCDPFIAEILREKYAAVEPGYHLNKQQWNTIVLDGSVPDPEVRDWIDASYDLVVAKMPKKKQRELAHKGQNC